jgi:gliding motility-associated-like protein
MELDWESPNEVTNHLNRISIGDLDRDGMPEVVSINIATGNIFILNGANGKIKVGPKKATGYAIEREAIIGNIDNDACAEIFTYGRNTTDKLWRIYAYDCKLDLLWSSPIGSELPDNPYYLSLADFDGDGKAEIYYKDEIVDAHTGIRIVQGGNFKYLAAPVAVDIRGDKDLELVAGLRIYDVDLGARTLHSGSLTLLDKNDTYRIRQEETSTTSVADYDLDGVLDVLATGSSYTGKADSADITKNNNRNTTLFFWNGSTGALKTYIDAFNTEVNVFDCKNGVPGAVSSGKFYQNGWRNGTGRINIADIDGDGKLNAVYVSGKYLYALKEDFTQKWRIDVQEETSGYTGCTMFDFNGDGKSEIVYRDEKNLYIIDGVAGVISNPPQKCISRTNRDYPIVADVDADGSTEICVTCAFDDNLSDTDFCNQGSVGNQRYSVVRAFKSKTDPWVPARRLWNQHGYFNVNINDDLSIPKQQQKSHVVLFSGQCRPGDPIRQIRPLNSFLNQSPFLDSRGCPKYVAANLVFNPNVPIDVIDPTCPDTDFIVTFGIKNEGDASINNDLPVTFYRGDPRLAGAIKLNTHHELLSNFGNGDSLTITATVKGNGSAFTLFIALNDAGTSTPPVVLPNNPGIIECDYNNFQSSPVNPGIVALTTSTKDNLQCTPTAPTNGSATASIVVAGEDITTEFNFFWSDGDVRTNPTIPPDFTGITYTGLADGPYTVYAIHKTANCGSDTTLANVLPNTTATVPTIDFKELHAVDNCTTPNGKLDAIINDDDQDGIGESPSNFTFEWYEGATPFSGPIISISHDADILKPTNYSVYVVDKRTGCDNFRGTPTPVTDNRPELITDAIPSPADCSGLTNGSITSSLTLNGASVDLTPPPVNLIFKWYRGNKVKPGTPDFSTPDISGLSTNSYTLFVTDNISGCSSDTITRAIIQKAAPTITGQSSSDQLSCIPSDPSGSASVNMDPALFDFQWFRGQGTTDIMTDSTENTILGLIPGKYTVLVTDENTQCSNTEEFTILDGTGNLTVSPTAVANASCSPKTGQITVTASAGAVGDYTYFLDNGITVIQQTDNNIFSGLDAGSYTVWAVNDQTTCETDTKPATVTNSIPAIVTGTPNPIAATDCRNGTGTLFITASGNTSGNFTFDWYAGGDTSGSSLFTETGPSSSFVAKTGNYTTKIFNPENGCSTEVQQFLPIAFSHTLTASKIDVNKCEPVLGGNIDAALTITTTAPGFTFAQSDYTIKLYSGSTDPDPDPDNQIGVPSITTITGSGAGVTENYPFANFDDGFYTVVAISNLAGSPTQNCRVASTVQLKRVTKNPTINRTITDNAKCAPKDGGMIHLLMGTNPGVDDNPNFYDFSWPALSAANISGVNGEDAINLTPNSYTVTATVKNNLPNGGCSTTKTIPVLDKPKLITIPNINASVNTCNPLNGTDASTTPVTLNAITDDGVNRPLPDPANYTLLWKRNDGSTIATNVNPVPALLPGDYSISVTKTATGCQQTKSFTVQDLRDKVGVDLIKFSDEVICLGGAGGFLEVAGTTENSTPALGYKFAWFNGADTLAVRRPEIVNSISGLSSTNQFTVKVTNRDNNCAAFDVYTISPLPVRVMITASSSPLTNCDNLNPDLMFPTIENASLSATVILPPDLPTDFNPTLTQADYTFEWRINGVLQTTPQYSSNIVTNVRKSDLELGVITVTAIENANPTNCFSTPVTVPVDTTRIRPDVSAITFVPVSNCDLLNPNGMASASVGDDITNYLFDWFEGPTTTPRIGEGPLVDNLKAHLSPDFVEYTVRATDRLTGCTNTASVQITYNPEPIIGVTVEVMSNVTNCRVSGIPYVPNGALLASVKNEVSSNYSYQWTNSNDSPIVTSPQITVSHDLLDSLDAGTYKVIIVDNITKCLAETTGTVDSLRVKPAFEITTTAATCRMGDGGSADGFAAVFLTNNIQIEEISWMDSQKNPLMPAKNGPILSEVEAGSYWVKIISQDGCVSEQPLTIKTEVHPFNGISRNNDGKNDIFHINCIDNFENNLVKIYNRAGTLVYEASNYNNIDIYFDGKSNKGVSLMGTNLPDGTYFYIIDKRDGSKQLAGYLEIVN